MEDLKERYYKMARTLLISREGSNEAVLGNHPLVRWQYNAAAERLRKAALVALAERDPEAEEADNQVGGMWTNRRARREEGGRRARKRGKGCQAEAAAQHLPSPLVNCPPSPAPSSLDTRHPSPSPDAFLPLSRLLHKSAPAPALLPLFPPVLNQHLYNRSWRPQEP